MIDPQTKLTVKVDNNTVFTDHSHSAADFLRDDFSVTLLSATDYVYAGFTKPFGALYVHLTTPNVNANTLTAEIWDGTAWTAVTLNDDSLGWTRSGFLMWDKTAMESTSVDGDASFYIRFAPSVDHSATDVRGVNLIFSDDAAMKTEFFEVDNANLLPSGQTSHIAVHVSSRNRIVHEMNKLSYEKNDDLGNREKVDQWDLIDIFEVRQAATFLALSTLFFNLSDSIDDHWWVKYREYQNKYEESLKVARLSVDIDDDGVDDTDEVMAPVRVQRWNR